jgi:hypothetical protein
MHCQWVKLLKRLGENHLISVANNQSQGHSFIFDIEIERCLSSYPDYGVAIKVDCRDTGIELIYCAKFQLNQLSLMGNSVHGIALIKGCPIEKMHSFRVESAWNNFFFSTIFELYESRLDAESPFYARSI